MYLKQPSEGLLRPGTGNFSVPHQWTPTVKELSFYLSKKQSHVCLPHFFHKKGTLYCLKQYPLLRGKRFQENCALYQITNTLTPWLLMSTASCCLLPEKLREKNILLHIIEVVALCCLPAPSSWRRAWQAGKIEPAPASHCPSFPCLLSPSLERKRRRGSGRQPGLHLIAPVPFSLPLLLPLWWAVSLVMCPLAAPQEDFSGCGSESLAQSRQILEEVKWGWSWLVFGWEATNNVLGHYAGEGRLPLLISRLETPT